MNPGQAPGFPLVGLLQHSPQIGEKARPRYYFGFNFLEDGVAGAFGLRRCSKQFVGLT
jgi:hypothetical protein